MLRLRDVAGKGDPGVRGGQHVGGGGGGRNSPYSWNMSASVFISSSSPTLGPSRCPETGSPHCLRSVAFDTCQTEADTHVGLCLSLPHAAGGRPRLPISGATDVKRPGKQGRGDSTLFGGSQRRVAEPDGLTAPFLPSARILSRRWAILDGGPSPGVLRLTGTRGCKKPSGGSGTSESQWWKGGIRLAEAHRKLVRCGLGRARE